MLHAHSFYRCGWRSHIIATILYFLPNSSWQKPRLFRRGKPRCQGSHQSERLPFGKRHLWALKRLAISCERSKWSKSVLHPYVCCLLACAMGQLNLFLSLGATEITYIYWIYCNYICTDVFMQLPFLGCPSVVTHPKIPRYTPGENLIVHTPGKLMVERLLAAKFCSLGAQKCVLLGYKTWRIWSIIDLLFITCIDPFCWLFISYRHVSLAQVKRVSIICILGF